MIHHTLKALLHIAATNDIRFYMKAINIRQESEHTLRLEATNGDVAMWVRHHTLPQLLPVGETQLVDRASLANALKLGQAELHVDAGVLMYGQMPLTMVDCIGFPDFDRVIPAKHSDIPSADIGVDAKLLSKICKAIEELNHGLKAEAGFLLQPRDAMQPILFAGSAMDGAVTFRAAMMPCRVSYAVKLSF